MNKIDEAKEMVEDLGELAEAIMIFMFI